MKIINRKFTEAIEIPTVSNIVFDVPVQYVEHIKTLLETKGYTNVIVSEKPEKSLQHFNQPCITFNVSF